MGVVRRPGTTRLYFRFKDASGTWVNKPSRFRVGEEKLAGQAFALAMRNADTSHASIEMLGGDTSVASYVKHWCAARTKRELSSARVERAQLEHHVVPLIGSVKLEEVRAPMVAEVIRKLRKKPRAPKTAAEKRGDVPVTEVLSNKSVRNIYGTLHAMFQEAVADGLILANPCTLRRGELPPKKDKDPTFRRRAVFAREELEVLISDARIPEYRRTVYALLFLTGMRPGELIALRWRDYESDAQPLGRLVVCKAYSRTLGKVKDTKTGIDREIPVHPTLAAVLATWRSDGWQARFGRAPTLDDQLMPGNGDELLSPEHLYRFCMADLDLVGLRRRRLYDSRRTFTSLAIGAGAPKDVLRWITHGVRRDILDEYTTVPWPDLCTAVLKIRAELPRREEPNPADPAQAAVGLVQELVQVAEAANEKAPGFSNLGPEVQMSAEGIERAAAWQRERARVPPIAHLRLTKRARARSSARSRASGVPSVPKPMCSSTCRRSSGYSAPATLRALVGFLVR